MSPHDMGEHAQDHRTAVPQTQGGAPHAALAFSRWARPTGPWVLTAIPPEGGLTATATFKPEQADALTAWIAERDGKFNLYWMVNPARGPLTSKAKKEHVAAVEFLHVDVDPKPGGDLDVERERIRLMLEAFRPKPSAIVDSGGGFQAFWRLQEPIHVGGDLQRAAEIERYNVQLARELGGDACQNIDRVMRLPGTLNMPDEKKRKKGRVPRVASVVAQTDLAYPIGAFTAAAERQESVAAGQVTIPPDLPRIRDLSELDAYGVDPRVQAIIVSGADPEKPKPGDNSRSAWVLDVACQLVRAGVPDALIASVLLDPDFAISESVLEQRNPREYAIRQVQRAREKVAQDEATAPQFSEEALALKYAARHVGDMRFVAKWGRWMIWGDQRWAEDTKRRAFDRARAVCREAAAEYERVAEKSAPGLVTAAKRAAVLSLASDDQRLAATVEQWDAAPWLLNTPEGVVDLKTGGLRAARPEDYQTKITAVGPGGDCPLWRNFLDRVTDGDTQLQAYLQRVAGYALTGETREHALFFLHGLGSNGKSVFIATLSGLLGDYHTTAPMETFVAAHTDRHPTELAMLRGARLVSTTETEEGVRWAESKIKALTGGDRITARFMRQDFFEFIPQFKLLVAGNHKPGLRSVDEAIRRRFHLVPFEVTIPEGERDKQLAEKLKAEWPGILAWAIEGCREWQAQGLSAPERVLAATAAYLEGEDALATWLADCCEKDPNAWTSSAHLFASWQGWAGRSGEYVGSRKRFSQKLAERGYRDVQRDDRGFLGLRLKPPKEEPLGFAPREGDDEPY